MSRADDLHESAMELVEQAYFARRHMAADDADRLLRRALELEESAAVLMEAGPEPTRSVLFRSAASIAVQCRETSKARKLAYKALSGDPPASIRMELEDILEETNFRRHLEVRGIELESQEFQLSIAGGDAVGFGIASTGAFIGRIQNTEKLLYRTAERRSQRPYREKGQANRLLKDSLELYLSVPRAASFAVSFRIGRSEQLYFEGLGTGEVVVNELLDCLELFNASSHEELSHRIGDAAYYRNFLGLAKSIAPDGTNVKFVGFTAVKNGQYREVALNRAQADLSAQLLNETAGSNQVSIVEVRGRLRLASALNKRENQIKIKAPGSTTTVIVPEGMMDDIVKPMWGSEVVVVGRPEGRKIRLVDIKAVEEGKP